MSLGVSGSLIYIGHQSWPMYLKKKIVTRASAGLGLVADDLGALGSAPGLWLEWAHTLFLGLVLPISNPFENPGLKILYACTKIGRLFNFVTLLAS